MLRAQTANNAQNDELNHHPKTTGTKLRHMALFFSYKLLCAKCVKRLAKCRVKGLDGERHIIKFDHSYRKKYVRCTYGGLGDLGVPMFA